MGRAHHRDDGEDDKRRERHALESFRETTETIEVAGPRQHHDHLQEATREERQEATPKIARSPRKAEVVGGLSGSETATHPDAREPHPSEQHPVEPHDVELRRSVEAIQQQARREPSAEHARHRADDRGLQRPAIEGRRQLAGLDDMGGCPHRAVPPAQAFGCPRVGVPPLRHRHRRDAARG